MATARATDPFVKAGLMARATLEAGAAFAAVFAASPQVGSFVASRSSVNGTMTTTSPPGGFPVNPPQTWLRLRRLGNAFTGYGSLDGQTWVQLGTVNVTLPSTFYFGIAVSSGNAIAATTAQFREIGRAHV